MSDFSDRPFVAGSLTGVRVFDVDSLGRLRGVSVAAVFKPGENVAECRGGEFTRTMRTYMQTLQASLYGPSSATLDPPPLNATATTAKKAHHVGHADCSCGFYAYYDEGSNPHDGPGKVTALIEGYGVCAVGTRGFRAEKARLVALVNPTQSGRHPDWYDRLSDWCGRHSTAPSTIGVFSFLIGLATLPAIIAGGFTESPWWFLLILPALSLIALTVVLLKADFHAIDRRYPTVNDLSRCSDRGHANFDLVARAYPDVPVYRTLKAALADHPLTTPPAPTPDDEDFWTRSAS